jgi:hypothetical protein
MLARTSASRALAMRWLGAALAGMIAALAASPAAAHPGGFGCLWPVNNLPEDAARSRYYRESAERVYTLRVYLNEPAPAAKSIFDDQGISIGEGSPGPHKVGVCKVVPPHLESIFSRITWREVKGSGDPGVFNNIEIREAENAVNDYPVGSFNAWLVLRPKTPAVHGAVTIEFHVHTAYISNAL